MKKIHRGSLNLQDETDSKQLDAGEICQTQRKEVKLQVCRRDSYDSKSDSKYDSKSLLRTTLHRGKHGPNETQGDVAESYLCSNHSELFSLEFPVDLTMHQALGYFESSVCGITVSSRLVSLPKSSWP